MRLKLFFAAAAGAAVLAGCEPSYVGVGYSSPGYWDATVGYSLYTDVRPPAPLYEVRPYAPGSGYAWINGHWYWAGDTYQWRRGYWGRPPYPGYVWSRSGWSYLDGRYGYYPGGWVHYRRYPSVDYLYPRPEVRYGRDYRVVYPSRYWYRDGDAYRYRGRSIYTRPPAYYERGYDRGPGGYDRGGVYSPGGPPVRVQPGPGGRGTIPVRPPPGR